MATDAAESTTAEAEMARQFLAHGGWSEADYFVLSDRNWLVELADGRVEVLPMPTFLHQLILVYLFDALRAHLAPERLGTAMIAPLRMRLGPGLFREPDLLVLLSHHAERMQDRYWIGADLVVEILSPDNRSHDLVTKRQEYAAAGIPEYWIVDPQAATITVLGLEATAYAELGTYPRGARAGSRLLPGFGVDVSAVFDVKP